MATVPVLYGPLQQNPPNNYYQLMNFFCVSRIAFEGQHGKVFHTTVLGIVPAIHVIFYGAIHRWYMV